MGMREARRAIIYYLIFIASLTFLALAIVNFQGHILHRSYPSNTVLFDPGDRFQDFNTHANRIRHFNEPDTFTRTDLRVFFPYSVPTVYVFLFFIRCFPHPLFAYLALTVSALLIAAAAFAWSFRDSPLFRWTTVLIAFSVITSFPFWYLIDRANIEGIVWIAMLAGTIAIVRNRPILAAVAFALATSMKYFPAVMLLLFLARRQYKAFFLSISLAVGIDLASLHFIGPSITEAMAKFAPGVKFLHNQYIVFYRSGELGFDHSAFALLKQFIRLFYRTPELTSAHMAAVEYPYAIAVILAVAASFWFRLRHLPVTNQFIAYVAFSVLLPFVSNDYTLTHMHFGFALFLLFLVRDFATGQVAMPRWFLFSILLSFAILFTPQSYLLVGTSAGVGGQVKAFALIALVALVMVQPLPSARFSEIQARPAVSAPLSPLSAADRSSRLS